MVAVFVQHEPPDFLRKACKGITAGFLSISIFSLISCLNLPMCVSWFDVAHKLTWRKHVPVYIVLDYDLVNSF